MKQPIIKILTRCTLQAARFFTRYTLYATLFFLIIAAAILCTKSPTIAADPPHSSANSVYCNSCHSVHNASGTSLTKDASNANLCQSCHNVGGLAETKQLNDSMLATPGTLGTSHRWDATMPAVDGPDNQYGLIPTANLTNAALKSRLTTYGSVITCSVCHNQHGQADTPWDPNAPAYNGQGTGNGRHFQRISDDLNQMCEDCHYYRTAATTGTDVKNWDGNKKSHPVVKNLTTDVIDANQFVGAAPLETNNSAQTTSPRYHQNGTDDTNATNNIVLDSSGKTRCLSCHGIHYADSSSGTIDGPGAATGDGYLLKRSPEETCHACHKTDQNRTGSSPDWADAIKTHNANRFGTCTVSAFSGTSQTECVNAGGTWTPTTKWGTNWGLSGGKYGEIVCTTCHTAHDTKHIYLIKETIKTPDDSNFQGRPSNSVSVDFRTTAAGNSGDPGLMGDDTHAATTSSRICEVCHTYDATQTSGVNKHAYDMSAGAVNHQGIGGCTSCHSHKGAFTGGGCNGCHGYPPVVDTAAPPDGLAWTNPTGSTTAGAHNLHYTTKSYPCTACHYNSSGSGATHGSSGDGLITMGFYMFDGDYQGGNYDGQTGTDGYNVPSPNTTPATTVTELGNKTCSLYCHGSTLDATALPVWSGTISCGSCHTALQTDVSRGSHARHARSAPNRELACTVCHSGYTLVHVNGSADWAYDTTTYSWLSGALYNGLASGSKTPVPSASYDTCSNLYCHSDVQTDGGGATTYLPTPQWGGTVECGDCHKGRKTDATTMDTGSHTKHVQSYNYDCSICHNNAGTGATKHADYNIDVAFTSLNPSGTYSQSPNTPENGYGTCSTTYCHGTTTPQWGGASFDCAGCHLANNSLPATHAIHYNDTAVVTSNTTTRTSSTTDYKFGCGNCHDSSATTHANGMANEPNRSAEISFAGYGVSGAYSEGGTPNTDGQGFKYTTGGGCTNTYCHGNFTGGLNDTPTWDDTESCGSCHGASAAAPPGITGSLASHTKHIGSSGYLQLSCNACHSDTAAGFVLNNMDKHVDKNIDWNLDETITGSRILAESNYNGANSGSKATVGGPYNSCTNIYCHSIVQTSTGGELTLGTSDYKTVQWGSGAMTCASCHDNPPASGSHSEHAVTYSFTCAQCHNGYGPPTTAHADGSINTSIHTNWSGAYEGYTTPGSGFSYCSNTYCHSNGTSVSTGLIPANASPNWGGGEPAACGSCHGEGLASGRPTYASGSPKTNSHSKHLAYACNKCHVNTTSDGTTITGKANHVNKTYDVNAGAGASFTYAFVPTGGTCSSISCHYDGGSTWGATLSCGSCHATPPDTGAHLAHTDGDGAAYDIDTNDSVAGTYRFNCGNCHPLDAAKHGDGTIDVELYNESATGFKQYNPPSATRTGTGVSTVCKNVYCHSNGMAAATYADTPSWGGTFAGNKCAGCHGDPPNAGGKTGSAGHYSANWMGAGKEGGHLVGIHFDNVYTGTTGLIAKGGGAGSGAAHGDPGTSTTISCNLCHTATTEWTTTTQFSTKSGAGTAFDCATCHTGANPIQNTAGTITDKSKHVNHVRDVQFASFTLKSKSQNRTTPAGWTRNSYKAGDGTSYDNITFSMSYNASEKSCMTSCHLGHAIKWDDTNITTCYSCHKDL